jgi:hypothetical protein
MKAGGLFEITLSLPTFMSVSWQQKSQTKVKKFRPPIDHEVIVLLLCCFANHARELNGVFPFRGIGMTRKHFA